MRTELVERVRRRLATTGGGVSADSVADAVRAEVGGIAGDADVLAAVRQLRDEFVGVGPLEPLIDESGVTDVLVTAPDQVWVDGAGGLRRTAVRFDDDAAVRRLAQRLALAAGRRLDDAQPYVDGWLPGGDERRLRFHAVLPPIAADGTCLSLRVLCPTTYDLARLVELGTLDEQLANVLRVVVAARLAFLVSGGTGSGKSTLLGALLGQVPPTERIVCIEDVGELRPGHPQLVRLLARSANVEGAGEVTLRDLVRQALRMRPDRIVVGEVRGSEACELLNALNTGHDGGSGTVHANAPAEVPARMEALAALGGLPRDALHSQLGAAVQLVVHMCRRHDGRRVVGSLGVLVAEAGDVVVRPVWTNGGWTEARALLDDLLRSRGVSPP